MHPALIEAQVEVLTTKLAELDRKKAILDEEIRMARINLEKAKEGRLG